MRLMLMISYNTAKGYVLFGHQMGIESSGDFGNGFQNFILINCFILISILVTSRSYTRFTELAINCPIKIS